MVEPLHNRHLRQGPRKGAPHFCEVKNENDNKNKKEEEERRNFTGS